MKLPLESPRVPRGALGRLQLALHEVEAGVPEARVREVDADDRTELLRRQRPARAQELQVGGDERLAQLLVATVYRERQQVAVGVGVHIPRRVDEVPDVRPP